MFSPRQGLIANDHPQVLGGSTIYWLTDERFAMAAIVIATIWWSLGIAMILFPGRTAGHQQGDLRGRRDRRRDRRHRLPPSDGCRSLKRTITLVVVLQIILHFQVFGQAHLMTQGGPNDETQVLVRYIYQTAFRDSDLGQASAMAVFLFVIIGALLGASVSSSDGNRTDETEPRLCLALRPPGRAGLRLARADAVDGLAVVPAERRPGTDDRLRPGSGARCRSRSPSRTMPTCSPSAGHLSGS